MFRWWSRGPRAPAGVLFILLVSSLLAPVGQGNLADLSASLSPARSDMAIAFDGEEFLLFGGRDDSTAYDTITRYDPASGAFSTDSASLPAPRFGMAYAQVGDLVYLFGGYDATSTATDSIWTYDMATGNIATLTAVLPVATAFSAAAAHGDSVWIMGGEPSPTDAALDTILEFDVTSDSFTSFADTLEVPVEAGAAAASADHVYLFGGEDHPASTDATARIQRLDPVTGQVKALSIALPQGRAGMAAYYDQNADAIVVLGGFDRDATGAFDTFYDDIHVFDVATESIDAHEDTMPSGRALMAAAHGGADFAYFFGGAGPNGFLDDVLRFNIQDLSPVAQFAMDRVQVNTATPVQFTDASYDPDGNVVAWDWDFGDGRTSQEQHPRISYPTKGLYTIMLSVVDDEGHGGRVTQTLQVNGSPPTASFSVDPVQVQTDIIVRFEQSSNDLDGEVVAWTWDFGDGTGATGPVVEHAYRDAGPIVVTLTVTDNDGLSTTVSKGFDVTPFRDCEQPNHCVTGTQRLSKVVLPYRGDILFEPLSTFTVTSGTISFERDPQSAETLQVRRVLIEEGASVQWNDVELVADDGVVVDLIVKGRLELSDTELSGLRNVRVLGTLASNEDNITIAGSLNLEGTAHFYKSAIESHGAYIPGRLTSATSNWDTTAPIMVTGDLNWGGGEIASTTDGFYCDSGALDLRGKMTFSGAAIDADNCPVKINFGNLTGTGTTGDFISVTGGRLDVANSQVTTPNRAVHLTQGAAALLVLSQFQGAEGLIMDGADNVQANGLTITGTSGAAVRCDDLAGRLSAVGGTWAGKTIGFAADDCSTIARDVTISGDQIGAVLDNPGRSSLLQLTDVHVKSAGRGIQMQGAMIVRGLDVDAPEGLRLRADSSSALSDVRIINVTGCGVCVDAGHVRLTQAYIDGPLGTAFHVTGGFLDAHDVNLGVLAADAHVVNGFLNATDVPLDPASTSASGNGRVIAQRTFTPVIQYKNGQAVEGAQVSISKAGTQLATGTTGADGTGPGVIALMFERHLSGISQGSPLRVDASRAGLVTQSDIGPSDSLVVTLVDDVAPGKVSRLVAGTVTDNGQVQVQWREASDDHLAPKYRIQLSVPEGDAIAGITTVPVEVLTTQKTTATVNLPGPGTFRIGVVAIDTSGNAGDANEVDVTWDSDAPAITLDVKGPQRNGWYRNATVTVSAEEPLSGLARFRLMVDGVDVTGNTVELTKPGRHTIEVEVTDGAGNVARRSTTVMVDGLAPTVPTLRTGQTMLTGDERATLYIQGTPSDAHSGVLEVMLERRAADGTVVVLDRFAPPLPLSIQLDVPEGRYQFVLIARDRAGNTAESRSVTIAHDDEPPVLADVATGSGGVTFRFDDTVGVASIVIYDGDQILASGTGETLTVSEKTLAGRNLRIVATDVSGKSSETTVLGDEVLGVLDAEAPGLGIIGLMALLTLLGLFRRPPTGGKYSNRFMSGVCGCNDGGAASAS